MGTGTGGRKERYMDSESILGDVLKDLFDGDEQIMGHWLEAPVPALEGKTPRDLMETIAGRKVLESYVEKLKRGDYS